MQTYFFYDLETTGLNKAFDQILQFAGIRTDLNFNEIERYELKIKLNSDVIPSPSAFLTHQINPQTLTEGLSEWEGIKQIHQWLNHPGTISLGYNTLGFDDEFLRFSFYRNLLPPYTHQYANQCSRMDLYPITIFYFLFKNTALIWPEAEGKISLKLENLQKANQLASGGAHNAMIDAEATLELTKRLHQEQEMWNYITGYFNKQTDQKRLEELRDSTALMIQPKLGYENYFQSPVLLIGQRLHYKQLLWLSLDAETFTDVQPVTHKKLGEPPFILPFHERFLKNLSLERQERTRRNKKYLYEHSELLEKITTYQTAYYYPVYPETDAQAALYLNGFWTKEEEAFCRAFHAAPPKEKSRLTSNMKNPHLQELAIRLLGRHFPEVMTSEQTEKFLAYLKKIKIDHQGNNCLTRAEALNQIAELGSPNNKWDVNQRELLTQLQKILS